MKIRHAVLLAVLFSSCFAQAQTSPRVKSLNPPPNTLLLVGNSFFYFNDSMHRYLGGMVAEGMPELRGKYRATSVTISGAGLNWHDIDAYLKPGSGMASYSFTADNKVVFNTFDKPYEAVIMNDCSQCPIHPQLKGLFHEFAKKHSESATKRGARSILFMTWAYQDMPEMTAQLAEQYTIAGNANDALVIPAGLAFARSVAKSPGLNLYNADKRHPTLAGSFLGAATIYAALYGKSPAGLKYRAELDETAATFLKQVAWEAVSDYYKR
jgi:hypothetical protein